MTLLKFKIIKNFYECLTPGKAALVDFLLDVVIIFALILLVVKPFFFAPFRVQQESMMPNVFDGEFIITWKLPYHKLLGWREYERNDIVVFRPTTNPENYLIKRVIGLPKETLRLYQGKVWVKEVGATNFRELKEDFLYEGRNGNTCLATNFCSEKDKAEQIDFEVPANKYFVLGDNRTRSRDSRTCFVGNCQEEGRRFLGHGEIDGKVILNFARYLNNPKPFWQFWEKVSFQNIRLF